VSTPPRIKQLEVSAHLGKLCSLFLQKVCRTLGSYDQDAHRASGIGHWAWAWALGISHHYHGSSPSKLACSNLSAQTNFDCSCSEKRRSGGNRSCLSEIVFRNHGEISSSPPGTNVVLIGTDGHGHFPPPPVPETLPAGEDDSYFRIERRDCHT
jgi:hypothetical protein